jgi:TPR repeat protein
VVSRSRWVVFCAVQALWVACASAATDDEYRLGLQAYQRGDVASAMGLLRAPARAGHAGSQTLLAFILERADLADEAARLYTQAAAQGDADAHAALADLYLTGRGVAKDEKRALEHFSKAAQLGHAASIEVLASAHLKGTMGLGSDPRDNSAAVGALRRAADQGHLVSVEALAQAYRRGGFGLEADAAQAAAWQARADELRRQRAGPPAKARP